MKIRGSWRALRRWVVQIHLWTALLLCPFLILLGLTGSVLVFEDELSALGSSVPAASVGIPQPIAAIVGTARRAAPERLKPISYTAPGAPGTPAIVRFAPPGRNRPGPGGVEILVDPVTLGILAIRPSGTGFLRSVFLLHANAMMAPPGGRQVIGWLGVAMMGLAVTGAIIWWPRPGRWRAAFRVRRGARGFTLHRDLHGAVGIWTLPVFLTVGFSGIYLGFPDVGRGLVGTLVPVRDMRGAARALRAEPIKDVVPATPDDVVSLVASRVRDGRLTSLALPSRPDQPYRASLALPGRRDGAPPVLAFVDPWRRSVIEIRDPVTFNAGETLIAWQHPLHAGAGLGPVWRVAVFLSGLLPALFGVTGTALWWLRRRRRAASAASAQ